MQDQVEGLNSNQIDFCGYLNSSITDPKKRRERMEEISKGHYLFVFISPERFQMEEFRDMLTSMYNSKKYFSYCVIDEVHCVSEWGHDFRPSYLSLGRNAIKFCRTKDNTSVTLIGLTATASFDVLADVQRELAEDLKSEMLREDAIVHFALITRPEIQYEFIPVELSDDEINQIYSNPNDDKLFWKVREKLSNKKKEILNTILEKIPNDFT